VTTTFEQVNVEEHNAELYKQQQHCTLQKANTPTVSLW